MWPYKDEQAAITDVLRLSRAMTYKAVMADLPCGGGKAIILGDPHKEKSPSLLRALGKRVQLMNGRFITGEDLGISAEDVDLMGETTSYVAGAASGAADLALSTVMGLTKSMTMIVSYRLGKSSLEGVKIAIQGLGHVGYLLCKHLAQEGAKLIVTDIKPDLVQRAVHDFKVQGVLPEDIYGAEVDIFSPCAVGAILNDKTIPQLKCSIIAGSANNQLENVRHGKSLMDQHILYAPDYVVNAGGLIDVSAELSFYDSEKVRLKIEEIPHTLMAIFKKAEALHIPTNEAADKIAEEKLNQSKTTY